MIVFVSYSSKNRKRIEDLVLQLGQLGHDVQFESKVVGGEITWQQVLDTVATSDLFVATLSSETLVSYSSRIETEYARDLNKVILFVALDEISTLTALDPQISANVVDFSTANPSANDALAAAINSLANLEHRPLSVVPPPNWDVALNELGQDIKSKSSDGGEQGEILLNLQEFLERHETFAPAKTLLAAFSTRSDLQPEIRVGARRLTAQVKRVGSLLQKLQRRSLFYGAIILSLLVSLAIVLLSQVVLQFRAQRGAVARLTSTAQTPRPVTLTVTPVQTRIAITSTVTPMVTATAPTQTAATVLATSTSIIPNGTSTLIPLITNTPRSVTETMVAQVATVTKPTVTSIPPVEITSTVTPKPATKVPATVTPTVRPTQVASLSPTAVPTITSTVTPKSGATPTPKPATKVPATVRPTQVASLSPTAVPTIKSTVTPKPSATSTPKPATKVPATVTPTVSPTRSISLLPALTPTANLAQLLPQSVYVGMVVEDTLFGVRVNVVGETAQAAGVQVGDYILSIDLDIVKTRLDFLRVMEMRNPFSNITLRLRRNNQTVVISLVLGVTDFAIDNPS